ncbi:MAG: ATP-dependent zinc metalloprotease FtsH [Planctomycetota bacterium]
MPSRGIAVWVAVFVGLFLLMAFWKVTENGPRYKLDEFYRDLREGKVADVEIRENQLVVKRGAGDSDKAVRVQVPVVHLSEVIKEINAANTQRRQEGKTPVTFTYVEPNTMWYQLLSLWGPIVLFLFLFWFVFLRQMHGGGGPGGVLTFGKSRMRLASKDRTHVTFDDVAGIDEAKEEVKEIIEFLKNPGKFQEVGGRIPKGVLLIGAPGTGKTLLAKAIAGEADVPFYSISGSDFVEMFVGVGASRVRDLFRQAKESAPCIVFLDEVDAVGRSRGAGLGGGHDEREQTLNAILVEMDGFESNDKVIVLAATNRHDVLDPALLRPGRFDREVVIDLPDLRGREEILKVHAKKVKLAADVDLQRIARGTPTFSGADLEALINESAIRAVMRGKKLVDMSDLEESRDKVRWGRQKRSRVMDEADRRITAFHESGHALIAKLLPEVDPLHKVTIVPRGMALGSTMNLPEKDTYHFQRRRLLGTITLLFGGRVAEELFCDDVSAGAQNDIERATEIARKMVSRWGMSDVIGPISFSDSEEHMFLGREIARTRHHSEKTSEIIDHEVKVIIEACYARARELIGANREACARIVEALLVYESLDASDVDLVMAGQAPAKAVKPNASAAPPAGAGTATA